LFYNPTIYRIVIQWNMQAELESMWGLKNYHQSMSMRDQYKMPFMQYIKDETQF